MLESLCIIILLLSYLFQQRRDYKQERILAELAEMRARLALLRLEHAEEEKAYQRTLENYR